MKPPCTRGLFSRVSALLVVLLALGAAGVGAQSEAAVASKLGLNALSESRFDAAIEAFQRCLRAAPHDNGCAYNLACAYSRKNQAATAVEWLSRAADWGYEDVAHMLEDRDLINARAHAGFWTVIQEIQNRLPASVPRRAPPRADRDRGLELVVMLRSELGSGAGIILSHARDRIYLATANHVVRRGGAEAQALEVGLKALAPRWHRARLLPALADATLDLAFVAVDGVSGPDFNFCSLPLHLGGDSARLRRGAEVYPSGYPSGILWAMPLAPDRVSQVFPSQISFESQFVRVGFSGGALFNGNGEIVGMITADEPPLARALPLEPILRAALAAGYPVHLSMPEARASRPLHAAAKAGDVAAMLRLLEACTGSNAADETGRTALHEAAAQGSGDAVRVLLREGARRHAWALINADKSEGEWAVPLHVAAKSGSAEAATALLAGGGDADLQTLLRHADQSIHPSRAALHFAAQHDHRAVAEVLLAAGARPDLATHNGDTALAIAAEHGSAGVAALLLRHGAALQPRDGSFPLWLAAAGGRVDILKLLVEHGANVDAMNDRGRGARQTALHAAAKHRQTGPAAFLIARNAKVDVRDYEDRTPLHVAAENGSSAVAKLLLAHGAKPNGISERGWTPIALAADQSDAETLKVLLNAGAEIGFALHRVLERGGHTEAVRVLVQGGAEVSLPNRRGFQPLHIAAGHGLTEATALLLKAGAPVAAVERPEYGGGAPLHLAAEKGHAAVVDLLLAAKAPINQRDASGRTALFRAVTADHAAVVERLLRSGADPNVENSYSWEGHTAVTSAASGRTEVLALLLASGGDANRSATGVRATPLYFAARAANAANTQLLLKAGAKASVVTGTRSPLHAAANARDDSAAPVIALLLAAGSPVDAKDEEGRTPLHVAAREAKTGVVRALLAGGASVRAVDNCGGTPLRTAMIGSNYTEERVLAIAELLLGAGADVNATTSSCDNTTVLNMIEQRGHLKLRQLLLAKGAKPARP